MAKVPDISISVVGELGDSATKAALYELLQSLGYVASADALYAAPGALTIRRDKADTRDGREEIIADVQAAFEDRKTGVIIINDSRSLEEVLEPYRGQLNTRTVGYA